LNKITFPLNSDSSGLEVANLQDGLRFLIDQRFYQGDPAQLNEFSNGLTRERAAMKYRDLTGRLVAMFQEQTQNSFGLGVSGVVDADTAKALNKVLQELGAFPAPLPVPDASRLVAGVVRRADQQPFAGGVVRAFHKDERGLLRLGEDNSDADGRYTIRYTMLPGVEAINLVVTVSAASGAALGGADTLVNAPAVAFVEIMLPQPLAQPPAVEQPPLQRSVEGRVVFENGLPAEGVGLRLYQQGFGGAQTLLSETTTQPHGLYALPFASAGTASGLEVRALDAAGNEISLTQALHNLGEAGRALVNLVVPLSLQAQPAEFDRLAADLAPHVGDLANLVNVHEDDQRQDLTLLNRAAGWDARLIAMASSAAVLSADQQVGLPHAALYGLLRMGLPSDRLQLAQVSPDVLDQALTTAVKSGIVALDEGQMAAVKDQFGSFSRTARLEMPAPGSNSTYGELLRSARVGDGVSETFARVFLNHQGDPAQLWEKAAAAGVPENDILTLQRQGKLAFLTANNVAMTAHLQQTLAVSDPLELVDRDLFEPETWFAQLNRAAGLPEDADPAQLNGGQAALLRAVIPPAFAGDSLAESRDAYAHDMARKLRTSYPTQVVGRLLERDAADEFALGETRLPVANFMKSAAGQAFRLGQTPVEAYFRSLPADLPGLDPAQLQQTKQNLKTLQRVYQITPSNEAMPVLMKLGLTSAHDITALSQELFVERYLKLSNSPEQAKMIYRKAQQVNAVTYNLFTIARKLDSQPPVSVISAPAAARQQVRDHLIKQFPTLESLFGSLDFCECEHCRSVLSPAAYLVDLLQFLDQTADVSQAGNWTYKMQKWETEHHNAAYPFRNLKEQTRYLESWRRRHPALPDPDTRQTPYEVLLERRPDLPHIPLTCENTHTALPYIDIVNEILEYYVANQALAPEAAHDTGSATSEELLAEPQYVITAAYKRLQSARYPLNLPFDLPLETVRRFSNYFEAPLGRLLELFRPGDALFAPEQTYDRFAVLMESLGLSPAESDLFIAADPLARWFELYGFSSANEATTPAVDADTGQHIDLNSAKALSRRLGLTYAELADILRTGFVNPGLANLAILHLLEVTIEQVLTYQQDRPLLALDQGALSKEDRQRSTEAAAFEKKLTALSAAFEGSGSHSGEGGAFDARAWLDDALLNNAFAAILVLADTHSGCDFDQTTLRFVAEQPADEFALALLKINLFVRLWRKLGWSIAETDAALQAFIPANVPFELAHLAQSPLRSALIYLAHLKELDVRLRPGKAGRLKLITFWAPIPSQGKDSLYAQLFLGRRVRSLDPVFDDALGEYLRPANLAKSAGLQTFTISQSNVLPAAQLAPEPFAGEPRLSLAYDPIQQVQRLSYQGVLIDPDKAALLALSPDPLLPGLLDQAQALGQDFTRLKGHLPALQSALGLAAVEIERVLAQAGLALAEAELSLANVSVLYRYALLAKLMKLPVADLITLQQLSGLNPFEPLSPEPLTDLAQDAPFTGTLAFLDAAEQVQNSSLRVADLDYLLCHRFDPHGKYRPDADARLALLRGLASGVRAVRLEHALPPEPEIIPEDLLRQKLGLALAPDAVERFLAMLNGTVEFTAVAGGVLAADALQPGNFTGEPSIRQVSYNATRAEQSLTLRGVLFAAEATRLKNKFPAPVLARLLDGIQAQARQFFASQLQKQQLRQADEAGFLDPADFDLLFAALLTLPKNTPPAALQALLDQNEASLRLRRRRVAQVFLPFLQRRLERQLVVQSLTAQTGVDPSLLEALLTDTRLLGDPEPVLGAFSGVGTRGLTVEFFSDADLANAINPAQTFADADTGLKDAAGGRLRPPAARSARFSGWLELPAPGAYRFYVALEKPGASASLSFAHLPQPFLQGAGAAAGDELGHAPQEFLELKPGLPYRFTLELRNLDDGEARLLVQGETLPKSGLAQLLLYPQAEVERFERAGVRLAKAVQLIQELGLNEAEARTLFNPAGNFQGLNLSELPVTAPQDPNLVLAGTPDRLVRFLRQARYTALKRELAGGTDGLLAVLAAPSIDQAAPLLARLLRRSEDILSQAARALTLPAPLIGGGGAEGEGSLPRLWQALQIVERFGAAPGALAGWTRIIDRRLTADEHFAIARDLRETIKARFGADAWQRIARSVFDPLRQVQRDALAAYVMQQHGFARLEQLYEYFLVDPGMQPVVQTSRIRLAISSVQLFIQRCLLNLEPQVHPAIINAQHWEWMKRYRVWEANRNIFLFPENWLEPEFRDDKTHLFRELESDLLQGDVSNDLVEDAFLKYLKKLEELARLNIVGMYVEEKDEAASNTLHVIGRTYSTPNKYFYRRYAHAMWTPWEPVSAEIQGEHLAPVVWRDRLYLFWVTFMDKSDPNSQVGESDSVVAQALKNPNINSFSQTKAASGNKALFLGQVSLSSEVYLAPTAAKKKPPTSLAEMSLAQIAGNVRADLTRKLIEVHLHWSEYFQGEWSTRASGEYATPVYTRVALDFDPESVFIHVSKEPDQDGESRGVKIHLGSPVNAAFYLAGRNAQPRRVNVENPPRMPYTQNGVRANRYTASGPLKVTYTRRITQVNGGAKVGVSDTPNILGQGQSFTLLPAANALSQTDAEIASLVSPFFYQSDEHTFFVEPNLVERTIQDWQEWLLPPPAPTPAPGPDLSSKWKKLVKPFAAKAKTPIPIDPSDPLWQVPIHPEANFKVQIAQDWLVNSATVLQFGGELIGPAGRAGLAVVPAAQSGALAAGGALTVSVGAGSQLAPETALTATPGSALEASGLVQAAGGLNVIGGAGLNAALVKNLGRLAG